jgi:predicted phosphodiesterase
MSSEKGPTDRPIRIFSDVHFGDRASRVHSLAQLRPLCEGAAALILNGDTLDTRAGPDPDRSSRLLSEVRSFFSAVGAPTTLLTGNHDPSLSPHHACDLADGQVFVTHGDIFYDEIVPWGHDAEFIRRRLRAATADTPVPDGRALEERLQLFRRVAASVPQRHQSERNPLKFAVRFATDTVWPPWRILRIIEAWRVLPGLAEASTRRHRPRARFAIVGHTHWPGVWRMPSGFIVINTGSFCRPFGSLAVDLVPGRLTVRRVDRIRGEYRPGRVIREFALAESGESRRGRQPDQAPVS